jgi:hypothetical protein
MSIRNHVNLLRFVLERIEDESGVSGTGVVAEGVEFSDGSVALRWRSHIKSTVVYESIRACEAVHGHGGRTKVVYLDDTSTSLVRANPWAE